MIKVNVSGKIFDVEMDILMKSEYFNNMINDCKGSDETIYVKRPPHVFKHVLACLIDDNYMCPIQYQNELEYFLIQHNKWYDPYSDVKKLIDEKINDINLNVTKMHKSIDDKINNVNYNIVEMYKSLNDKMCDVDHELSRIHELIEEKHEETENKLNEIMFDLIKMQNIVYSKY